ncbi:MAG: glycogen debranching protein GlgX [Phaeovulum sp.]|uniref:glycogen debranching protein GlgX n=1 Tax=Phaeovulum sp. TaxID=2934796 RepID=UPI0027300552|nr:glycogen debranching protein GlgX [Phaeovulum sp.]MDP2062886.1 glycogen debranching protein GlgX [Phaeovulum sp.]
MADQDIGAGPAPALGAIPEAGGVHFSLFSAHAERVELCLFDADQERRLELSAGEGGIWQGFVPGLGPGAEYGFRVHGPWAPRIGHRFDPAKLLLDPYARALSAPLRWSAGLMGQGRDTAALVPKSVVMAPVAPLAPVPQRSWSETVICEAHVKGLTAEHPEVPAALRGTYAGLAAPAMLEHFSRLGVTALELLPVHAFIDDRFVVERGLRNYWGYQSLGFFAPDPRYGGPESFAAMIGGLRGAGIEVILDVVFNHTGEGDQNGPTLAFRGIDNASYYRLHDGGYVNDTGCGNTLDMSQRVVRRLVLDSLRHWAALGVAGFRFDLATTLGRGAKGGFEAAGPMLSALRKDPVLSRLKLIAEPWDLGHAGYRLGEFPPPFAEWNDRFRDGLRRFWRGDAGMLPDLARRLAGSAETFDKGGRAATASVNYLASHDGFTLHDIVSFSKNHNMANGEGGRDGHGENFSANFGHEGASDDPAVMAAREARKRAMLASLFFAQGTPMWLAGDEIGNSQGGNNNAYAQDNATSWVNWPGDAALAAYVARLAGLRAANPVLRQQRFLHARKRADGLRDLVWRLPSGSEPTADDWHNPAAHCLCIELRGAAEGGENPRAAFAAFNAGGACRVVLPPGAWDLVLDSACPDAPELPAGASSELAAQSVQLFFERS